MAKFVDSTTLMCTDELQLMIEFANKFLVELLQFGNLAIREVANWVAKLSLEAKLVCKQFERPLVQ